MQKLPRKPLSARAKPTRGAQEGAGPGLWLETTGPAHLCAEEPTAGRPPDSQGPRLLCTAQPRQEWTELPKADCPPRPRSCRLKPPREAGSWEPERLANPLLPEPRLRLWGN